MYLQSTGTVLGDGNIFYFSRPLYIWQIHNQGGECYYKHDGILGGVQNSYLAFEFPLESVQQATGTSAYQLNAFGSGQTARLTAGIVYRFYPFPIRINYFGLWRISSAAQVHIFYSFNDGLG